MKNKTLAGACLKVALMAITGLTAAVASQPTHAAYPERPVRLIVPFAPGGGTDMISRLLAEGMARELKQPVIVENKPGAGTTIGSDDVARARPDGYTLLMATFAHVVNPYLHPKLPYDTDKAFAAISMIGHSPSVLVVRPDSPLKSVKDLIEAAQAKPGTITYASQGVGTSAHLAGELLESLAKVDMSHVPYRGAGPALNDLLGGHVDMMFGTAAAVGPSLQAGTLRALGVTTTERSPALPNIPTIAESGVPDYVLDSWYGLYAPAGTPPDVIATLNAAAHKAANTDMFRQKVQSEGLVISTGTPQELDDYIKGEQARWKKVISSSKITLD
ncbi:Bug family tripartite tricarboxylate transporter substrate binding protein [Advenella mimigardefordensis]|uniref:Putative Bug-like extracytoplasmic solute binding receptor, TTT family n=1 Tax=Advenella mimigardefordensis (strain DSM 17166 / LMG 22922 / DPN7) TaxID=1247726 RepID=W0P9G6_ADVMD|nr:tripartite tricarboxylate transporter substrate binding protein [Advenella mimigardefordensis]AHG63366.1 putative Bug-like extracytoplasmic solute binding receptor, TTT family [Advenella mimigardefordensis DPN7]